VVKLGLKIFIISALAAFGLLLVGCDPADHVFDPHVGTWGGTVQGADGSEQAIQAAIVPGGVITITNQTTGVSADYSYWTRFERDGEEWQLGMGVYPLGGTRDERFLLIQQSSKAPDSMLLETSEEGQTLLGFNEGALHRVD